MRAHFALMVQFVIRKQWKDVGHGVGVDHGTDLIVDAFGGQRFDVPIEVEVLTEPQRQQVGGVV